MTVKEAISNYGLTTSGERSLFDRMPESIRGLPRPLLLSLRNTFRRKGRLILTLLTLILAGAIFIAVFSVRESMYREFDQAFGYYQADVNAEFAEQYSLTDLTGMLKHVDGVTAVEGWGTAMVNILKPDAVNSDQVILYTPPANTKLITPVVTAGRWLRAG